MFVDYQLRNNLSRFQDIIDHRSSIIIVIDAFVARVEELLKSLMNLVDLTKFMVNDGPLVFLHKFIPFLRW